MNEYTIRPIALPAKIIRMMVGMDKWFIIIGLLDDSPFELFTIEANSTIEINITTGQIVMTHDEFNKSQFSLYYINSQGQMEKITDISKNKNREFCNYGLLITSMLQDKKPVNSIILALDKLEPDNDSINSWMNGVKRALKTYIADGETDMLTKCPVCGNKKMIYQHGCLTCVNCGYSKCG